MKGNHRAVLGSKRTGRGSFIIGLFLCIALCFAFASGCGEKSGETAHNTKPEKPQEEKKTPTGFIVFERDYKLLRARENGSGERTITSGFDTEPDISVDGSSIAYTHTESDPRRDVTLSPTPPPVSSIYISNSDGRNPERVTPQEWGTSSGWKPIFERQEGTVWVQRDCREPSFSQDGNKIAFVMRDHAYQETEGGGRGEYALEAVAVYGLKGPEKGNLDILVRTDDLFGGSSFSNPRFSTDGGFIYFNESPGGGPPAVAIARVNADGSNKTTIANFEISAAQGGMNKGYFAFDISPVDGSIAAVELSHSGTGTEFLGKITLMSPEGSDRRYIDTSGVNVGADNLCFSPDGKRLAFSTQEFGRETQGAPSDIYTVMTKGTGLKKVVTNGRFAAWGRTVK
ncbi:MAG: hypothetical protein PHP64_08280 [Actinomycetota bacterium]|nr:hypothetical protein [Actinomycetota bacterium]